MKKLNLKLRNILLKDCFYYALAIFSLIYALIYINMPKSSIYDLSETEFTGIISNYKLEGDKLSLVLTSKEDLHCNYYFKSEEEKIEYENIIKYGLNLKIKGTLKAPQSNTIPNTFNYKEYLYNHSIFYICTIDSIEILSNKVNVLYQIKNAIINRIKKYEIDDYLLTFIIGDKSLLDSETFDNYRRNGVTHLFAISGMHIGLFSAFLLYILKKIRVSENKRYIIVIIFIWFYAFLTGFSSSVLRAGLLFTILALNKMFYTEIKSINALILTGSILIMIKPLILNDIGFIYSFMTTFGLMYSTNTLSKHKILGTSIVSFLSSLPITINNFYSFNLLSILINIVFVPFVSIIVYPICLLSFALSPLEHLAKMALKMLEWSNILFAKINCFTVIMPKMPLFLIIVYYIVLLLLIDKNFKKSIVLIALVLTINYILPHINSSYRISFLDVGQGDSSLIVTPHNKESILIDTGGVVSYKTPEWKSKKKYYLTDNTITFMKSLGLSKLDYLILTHGDYDHMGEAINLVNNFKVEKVIFNCGPYNDLEKELIKVLDKKKIKYYSCIKELNIDKNKLYFLQTKEYDNENDNSNVIYTELDGYNFMFMGDASTVTEKEILNKYNLSDIDVLKVGHHGSKTSSGIEFINKIEPKYSIISVGKNNRYGHPNKDVLDNLKNSKIYRTDQDGSIMFKIKNNKLKIETCSS